MGSFRRGEAPTDVVRTPHSSNFSKVGVGAFGVSMNSNSDSLPVTLCGLDILKVLRKVEGQLAFGWRKGYRREGREIFRGGLPLPRAPAIHLNDGMVGMPWRPSAAFQTRAEDESDL